MTKIFLYQYCNEAQRIKSNDKWLPSVFKRPRTCFNIILVFFGIFRYYLSRKFSKRGPVVLKISPKIPSNVISYQRQKAMPYYIGFVHSFLYSIMINMYIFFMDYKYCFFIYMYISSTFTHLKIRTTITR